MRQAGRRRRHAVGACEHAAGLGGGGHAAGLTGGGHEGLRPLRWPVRDERHSSGKVVAQWRCAAAVAAQMHLPSAAAHLMRMGVNQIMRRTTTPLPLISTIAWRSMAAQPEPLPPGPTSSRYTLAHCTMQVWQQAAGEQPWLCYSRCSSCRSGVATRPTSCCPCHTLKPMQPATHQAARAEQAFVQAQHRHQRLPPPRVEGGTGLPQAGPPPEQLQDKHGGLGAHEDFGQGAAGRLMEPQPEQQQGCLQGR